MTCSRKLLAASFTASLAFALTACGGDADEASAPQTAPNGEVYNGADVAFASDMIPHHAQALVMVDMTRSRDVSPELKALSEEILAAQGPEIELMVDWLTEWDEPVPETMRDHANADDHGSGGHDMDETEHDEMPGMMSDDELADLDEAAGQDFEARWLTMMIEHHEGAIEMAREEQEAGVFEPAIELAKSIEESQAAEIDRMEELLDS